MRRGRGRIGRALQPEVAGDAPVWAANGARLCALAARGDVLVAEVQGEPIEMSNAASLELLLEKALRAHLGTLRTARSPRGAPAASKALLPEGPLLTGEELAALRGEG